MDKTHHSDEGVVVRGEGIVDFLQRLGGFAGVVELGVGMQDVLDLVDEAHKLGCFVLVLLVIGDGIVFSLRDSGHGV